MRWYKNWLVAFKTKVMKAILSVLSLFTINQTLNAQNTGLQSEQLKVEWKSELEISKNGARLTALIIGDNKLYYSMRGENGSGIFVQDLNDHVPATLVENTFIQNLNYVNGKLFTMGGCQLTRRNAMAGPEAEVCLQLQEGWNLSAVEGRVAGATAYGLHWANYLAAYDLNGILRWKKEIAELSQNEFLHCGGNYVYVYCQINKPSFGVRLMQYDTLGNQRWSVAPSIHVSNMCADKVGNVYLLGGVGGKCYVQKHDIEGKLIWSTHTEGISYLAGQVYGDSLFVCGGVTTEKPYEQITDDDRRAAWAIYSVKTGERILNESYDLYPGEGYPERFRQIAYDRNTGNVYLGGSYGQEGNGAKCILVKLSKEGNTTGLKDEKTPRTTFNVFPNPGGSKFTITCENSKAKTVKAMVRNLSGQVVYSKEISCNADSSFTLDLGKQPAGNYSLEIADGNEVTVKKILIE